tara:strand:- start:616 stop:1335 length:720 start_codon:yes stop_codon:yes gene_type:complete
MPDQSSKQLILNFPARPEFSFSNFVISQGSQLAFDSAINFCSADRVLYQSLFIFGPKNLGKTHLLLSIGNHAAENGAKAIYIQGADFAKKAGESKQTEINDVDYFLLDDIEALTSSILAQEKLYNIYNTIIEKGGKVAFTSCSSPEKIKSAETYLISRLHWGMLAEIKPIDDNTTAKIIDKLAQDINLILPENIIHFLLSRIPRDFISLQQAVSALNQESYAQKKKVSLSLVKKALRIR